MMHTNWTDKIAGMSLYETIMRGFMDRVNKTKNLVEDSKRNEKNEK